jgi:hypothetical protein
MAEFQVELGFALADTDAEDHELSRDVDLLESFGRELEAIASDLGPATAIVGTRYVALLTVDADSPIDAARRGADVVTEAMTRALEAHGHELEGSLFRSYDRLLVEPLVPA